MRARTVVRLLVSGILVVVASLSVQRGEAQGSGHSVAGTVYEQPGCMGYMRGATVTLNPPGWQTQTAVTDGSFAFSNVQDGNYTLSVPGNPFGSYPDTPVTVAGADVVGIHICPQGPIATSTPTTAPTPIPGGPDLTVDISGPAPLYTPVAPNESLIVVIGAHNLGDTAAGPVEVLGSHLGISLGATVQATQGSCTLTPNDLFGVSMLCDLGTLDPQGGSGPSSATITVSGQAPGTTGRPPGMGVLVDNTVTVDPDNKVAESNEGNNTASVTYFLVDPLPTPTPAPKVGPVGGIAEAPLSEGDTLVNERHSSVPHAVALGGLAAGTALVLTVGGWYARRRWWAG